jgi:hypothetical protein
MSTETPVPPRRAGPHAPLPTAALAAALAQAPEDENAQPDKAHDPSTVAEEDPRARAARRAAELQEHGSLDEGEDKFKFDLSIIPDGWSYEWKMLEVLGKQDPSYQVNVARHGWEAVPRSRHPEMMPPNYPGNTITRDGMILMERPEVITAAARVRDNQAARDQVRAKEIQLGASPTGQFERDADPRTRPVIRKSREATIPVPDK